MVLECLGEWAVRSIRVTNMGRKYLVKQGNGPPLILILILQPRNKRKFVEAPHRGCIILGQYRNSDSTALNGMLYCYIDILPFLYMMGVHECMDAFFVESVVEMINEASSDIWPSETQKHIVYPHSSHLVIGELETETERTRGIKHNND